MNWFQKRKLKNKEITPKGECLYAYCEKIWNGTWTQEDYIEAYENSIENMRETVEAAEGVPATREDVAKYVIYVIDTIKEVNQK